MSYPLKRCTQPANVNLSRDSRPVAQQRDVTDNLNAIKAKIALLEKAKNNHGFDCLEREFRALVSDFLRTSRTNRKI